MMNIAKMTSKDNICIELNIVNYWASCVVMPGAHKQDGCYGVFQQGLHNQHNSQIFCFGSAVIVLASQKSKILP